MEELQQSPCQTDDLHQKGHFPEHPISEFALGRFFDDSGHAKSLSYLKSLSLSNNEINNGSNSAPIQTQSEERTPENSYPETEESRSSGGNPVYV